ncbi:hypothetical protein BDZ91DRAFT_712726 [Kalaharituber pfeilii]|nr:hypothetical protein BDZ91DRAFT_712726 [Kalaharituber pfeilii]
MRELVVPAGGVHGLASTAVTFNGFIGEAFSILCIFFFGYPFNAIACVCSLPN